MTRSRFGRLGIASEIALALIAGAPEALADDNVIPSERCQGLWLVPVSFGEEPEKTQ